ncbi:probable cytochrome P450 6d4 [Ochlerotatus camptorhynchus]|uniref:probable cytochrome P450 6d4 n=1 Tax=Ochlerotatus camptorhynchus TaxID=644619 RepID=UPI0031DFB7DE
MLIGILLIAGSIFLLQKWIYSYWTRRGIPQLNPSFPFGDVSDTFKQRKSYAQRTADLYNQAVRSGYRFAGIYTLFQPVLLITDAELVKRILTVDFEHFQDRGVHVNERRDPLSAHLFSLAGAKWRRMRWKLSPAFTTAKLKAMFPTMMDCGRTLSTVIDRHLDQPMDIRDLMTRFTMDVIASVGFGVECNSLEKPDEVFRRLGMKFFSKSWKTSVRMLMAFVAPKINRFLQVKLVDDDVEEYMLELVRDTIARREGGGVVRKDFIQMLVQLRNQVELTERWEMDKVDHKKSLTVEEMAAQSFVFLNAGYETTSSTITFCLFELCRNREHLARVVGEIDRVLEGREISYETIGEMTYLETCIDETLRKYPISPVLFRKCTKPYKIPETEVVVEKGTLIHIPLLGLQYDARYYEDPLKFDPDRFAERSGDSLPYYSFGVGPRICIGLRMGKVMAKMALVELLSRYDFVLDSTVPDGEIELDPSLLMLQPKQNILLIPKKRVTCARDH